MEIDRTGYMLVLVYQLLYLILSEIPYTAWNQSLNITERLCLTDSNQQYILIGTICPVTGSPDFSLYLFQIFF
jgi:hypothetical protein